MTKIILHLVKTYAAERERGEEYEAQMNREVAAVALQARLGAISEKVEAPDPKEEARREAAEAFDEHAESLGDA